MTLPVKTQFIAYGAGVGAILIGSILAMTMYWTPRLNEHHHTIAQNEAAITAIQRQQQNLAGVTQQLSERQADQTKLNEELWGFSNEGAFYELWDTVAAATQTKITLESISEATPGNLPIRRDATVTISGSWSNLWLAIARLPTIKPMAVIQDFQFTPGAASAVTARMTLATLWYDDTLH